MTPNDRSAQNERFVALRERILALTPRQAQLTLLWLSGRDQDLATEALDKLDDREATQEALRRSDRAR